MVGEYATQRPVPQDAVDYRGTPDTYGAVQWMTRLWRAKELVSHLRLPSGALPHYYQVVVRVRFKNGTPVESSYVLHRLLQAPEQGIRPKK